MLSPARPFALVCCALAAGLLAATTATAINTTGVLWDAGNNSEGGLGNGSNFDALQFVEISSPVSLISGNHNSSMFVKADGTLWGMGDNQWGQLGIGSTVSSTAPVQVPGVSNVSAISRGRGHSLFAKSDGSLWAVGSNTQGQLGSGSKVSVTAPVSVLNGVNVAAVAAAIDHSFFIRTDGSLWAMGDGAEGVLGNGNTIDLTIPVQIDTGVMAIDTGDAHSLYVKSDGSLWGMGANTYGQLGVDGTNRRTTPIRIESSGVIAVAAGSEHSLYLKSDGSVWSMGRNHFGQLGLGNKDTDQHTLPQKVYDPEQDPQRTRIVAIAAGSHFSLFLDARRQLWGVGQNADGQLATGGTEPEVLTRHLMASAVLACAANGGTSDAGGSAPAITLIIREPLPTIVNQPASITALQTSDTGFQVTASYTVSALTYRWERLPAGSQTWLSIEGASYSGTSTNTLGLFAITLAMSGDRFRCVIGNDAGDVTSNEVSLTVTPLPAPVISAQPQNQQAIAGQGITLSCGATGATGYQWYRGGTAVGGATSATLPIAALSPADAGLYDVSLSNAGGQTLSRPAVVGVLPAAGQRTAGSVATRPEWQNIHHSNGATYDQFLLTGAAGTFSADAGQIARMSLLDTNESIVQVEMSGAGAITVVLEGATGPMVPSLYNQNGIQYMKGKPTIILAGADETTHFTIYSVGTATNPGVTRADATYVGWADVGVAGISSTNGRLGGIHQGNASYGSAIGYTGLYAPDVTVLGSLAVIHGIAASGSAQPYLYFGPGGMASVKIAGGSLAQPNGDVITVQGLSQVSMGAGQDSCGRAAPAAAIQTRLVTDAGTDVTAAVVVGP